MTDDELDEGADDGGRTSLGKAIAIRRVELGLKRNDLRDRSGLSYPYIAELENGSKRASSKTLAAVARALELSPSELLARAEALDDLAASTPRADDGELAARRSWFRSAVVPAAAARSAPPPPPPSQSAQQAPAAAAPARRARQADDPVTEERVREIVREELRAAGLLP